MKILLAEDEPLMLRALEITLRKKGHDVTACSTVADAIGSLNNHSPDLVITDLQINSSSGLDMIVTIRTACHKSVPVILISGSKNCPGTRKTLRAGGIEYLQKPFTMSDLHLQIEKMTQPPL